MTYQATNILSPDLHCHTANKTYTRSTHLAFGSQFSRQPFGCTSKLSMAHFPDPPSSVCSHMDNEVRPSDEHFRYIYEKGFKTWVHFYSLASTNRKLPPEYLSVQEAFPQYPSFPATALVECDEYEAYTTVSSLWGSSSKATTCDHALLPFKRTVQIGLTAKDPILLTMSDNTQEVPGYGSWFVSGENYLPVLILAWSYILSARWVELMPTICSLEYTQAFAPHSKPAHSTDQDQNTVHIDIDYADEMEARWWSAVLSPGQGWRATMHLEHSTFLAPWSIDLQPDVQFLVSLPIQQDQSLKNPTSSMACEYLTKFCLRHDITDQSHAALAAVILLPSVDEDRLLQLPVPRTSKSKLSQKLQNNEVEFSQTHVMHCPDRLLMLSCNDRSTSTILQSVFYDTQIECNTVTPWLQGSLSAIDTLAKNDPCIIGRMCMERSPSVAYLWIGATILNFQEELLRNVRRGMVPFDLESAAWSGTLQSFIQQPVSHPLTENGYITRADECRLLFLSRSDDHIRCPIVRWKPFGSTPVEDVNIEVRLHCDCGGHELQWQGLLWNNTDGECSLNQVALQPTNLPVTPPYDDGEQVLVSYEALNRTNEAISVNATRNILSWLRSDGWSHHEKEMSKHPWLKMHASKPVYENEDEIASDDGVKDFSFVASWVYGE
jgi:hypothetical protein